MHWPVHWCCINWVQYEMLMQSQNVDAITVHKMFYIGEQKQDVGDIHVTCNMYKSNMTKLSYKCEMIHDIIVR